MKNLLGILVLGLLWCNTSFAEWVYIYETSISENGRNFNVKGYVDNSVKKKNGYVYAWTLLNFDKKTKYGERSFLTHMQVDCDLSRAKDLQVISKSGPMGSGNLIETYSDVGGWKASLPGTNIETKINKICSF